jgi:hypothetical protein
MAANIALSLLSDASGLLTRLVVPLAPDKRMPIGIPISCSSLDSLAGPLPCVEAVAFESQRPQHFPPRFDEDKIRRIFGLEDELVVWIGQGK